MKKIGLVGGLSWYSTMEYYRLLNEGIASKLGEGHSAKLSLQSLDQKEFELAIERDPLEKVAEAMIVQACRDAEAAGAQVLGLCANGIHRFVPAIERASLIPLVHIVDAVGAAIARQGLTRVGLLGVLATMQGTFYSKRLARLGIQAHVPSEAHQQQVHAVIMNELVYGKFTDESRALYLAIIQEMRGRGIEGVILGCTEIPLLLKPEDLPIPSFSSTALHCDALVRAALAE